MNIDLQKMAGEAKAYIALSPDEKKAAGVSPGARAFMQIHAAWQAAFAFSQAGVGDDIIDDLCRLIRDARFGGVSSELGKAALFMHGKNAE